MYQAGSLVRIYLLGKPAGGSIIFADVAAVLHRFASNAPFLVLDDRPVVVRIERADGGGSLLGVLAEIRLIDDAVAIDDEGLHTGNAISHGPGNQA